MRRTMCHTLDQSDGIFNSNCIAWVARDLWQRKQTLSLGCALGLGSFTAINAWLRATCITVILKECN